MRVPLNYGHDQGAPNTELSLQDLKHGLWRGRPHMDHIKAGGKAFEPIQVSVSIPIYTNPSGRQGKMID